MDAVSDVKARLSIEDVVSEYVQLKRAGRNFKGLSPYSSEKTPSFVVSPEKQIWHDFSSNRGGDMFTFIQDMEGVDFKGALDILARKAGIDLDQYKTAMPKQGTKHKERLYELSDLAAKFYQVQLSKQQAALGYVLQTRKFTKETILSWRLGYAPNTGDALQRYATKQGFTKEELSKAGLSNRYGGDLFQGRLMIPLADARGRIVGFTARQLEADDSGPKYLNTPATTLYDKSRHVFGLHLAKEAIRKTKYVVLAEGNLDVIASHQAGIAQCVATAGTALTDYQLKALKAFTGDIRVCFDADRAGRAATERAIPIAAKVGVSLSVISVPDGKDPDELIRQDPDAWRETITKPTYALDWLLGAYKADYDLSSATGKRAFRDAILTVLRTIPDRSEQEHYVRQVAEVTGVSEVALREMQLDDGAPIARAVQKAPKVPIRIDRVRADVERTQSRLLALMLLQPRLRDIATTLAPEFLLDDTARALLQFIHDNPDFDGNPTQAVALRELSDYVKILVLQYEELYQNLDLLELRYEAERLQSHLVAYYVKTEKQRVSSALKNATDPETNLLLENAKQLDALLKKFTGGVT